MVELNELVEYLFANALFLRKLKEKINPHPIFVRTVKVRSAPDGRKYIYLNKKDPFFDGDQVSIQLLFRNKGETE